MSRCASRSVAKCWRLSADPELRSIWSSDPQQLFRQDFTDIASRTNVPFDVAFGLELFKGGYNRASRELVLRGEGSRAGEASARSQTAFQNFGPQRSIDPAIGWRVRRPSR